MTDPQHSTIISVWDHPESTVQFLEETLVNRDWRATIVYPSDNPAAAIKREETRKTLEQHGYIVQEGVSPEGQLTLQMHHLGDNTSLPTVLHEMGLAKGGLHLLTNPMLPLSQILHQGHRGWDALHHYFNSPAKVNGLIFCAAEGALSVAGADNEKSEKNFFGRYLDSWKNPSSALQNVAGTLYLGQSLTYLLAAKNNTDLALERLDKKMDSLQAQGKDATDVHYDPTTDKAKEGFSHNFTQFLRAHPIEIGAMCNNLGMSAYMGHAVLKKRKEAGVLENIGAHSAEAVELAEEYVRRKGFLHMTGFQSDIAGAMVSIAAWSLLMLKSKPPTPENGHTGLLDRLKENPQVMTGLMTTGSSSLRAIGAYKKQNRTQMWGEIGYIPGDLILMGTKNDEYGKATESDPQELAEGIVDYINRMPLILSSAQQTRFAHDIAAYLTQKMIEDLPPQQRAAHEAQLLTNQDQLANAITYRLHKNEHDRMDLMAEAAVKVIEKFPESSRAALSDRLAETLAHCSTIHANKDELLEEFVQAQARLGATSPSPAPKLVQMRDVTHEVGALVSSIPTLDIAALANDLHAAIAPSLGMARPDQTPTPADQHRLHETLRHQVQRNLQQNGHAPTHLPPVASPQAATR